MTEQLIAPQQNKVIGIILLVCFLIIIVSTLMGCTPKENQIDEPIYRSGH
jgi:hypothetical protein